MVFKKFFNRFKRDKCGGITMEYESGKEKITVKKKTEQ